MGMNYPGFAGIFIAVVVWFLPESPRYVMSKKGFEAGVEALRKMRVGDVTEEAEYIQQQMTLELEAGSVSWCELFTKPGLRLRVFISVMLQICQQMTGVNAFLGYAGTIFKSVLSNTYAFNTLWNGVMVIGCITGLLLLDSRHGGRRPQLIVATWLMFPTLILAAAALQFNWPGWVAIVCVCVYGFGFQLGWGLIPWVYPAEILTMAEKDKGVGFAIGLEYLANAVVIILTPYLEKWSISGLFYIFGGFNFLNLIFVYFFIKETKGMNIEDIPQMFGRGNRIEAQPAA